MLSIKLAIKEIIRSPKFSIFFLLNISIGLTGLIILDSFKLTFNDHIYERSKNLLGADLSIGGRRKLSDEKKDKVKKLLNSKEVLSVVDLFSMVRTFDQTRLVFLNQFESNFPFYGYLELNTGEKSKGLTLGENEVWVYSDLLYQLNLKIGDKLEIGAQEFLITKTVINDTSQTFQMGSIAPKIFISKKGIERAQLLKKGSTAYYTNYFQTPLKIDEKIEQEIIDIVDDTSLSVTTPKKSSEQIGKMINYLSDFLGLVSLVALFLSFLGIFYLYRSYLESKRKSIAVLKSIGMNKKNILMIQFWKLIIFSLLGISGALALSATILPLSSRLIAQVIPFQLDLYPRLESILYMSLFGVLGVFLVSYPLLNNSLKERANLLFQENAIVKDKNSILNKIYYMPLLLFMTILSVLMSHSIKIGLLFILTLLVIFSIFYMILKFVLVKISKKISFKSLELNLSLKYLSRYPLSTISIFLSLFFGSLMINFLPALEKGLQAELDGGLKGESPSLFLFDIQDEQVSDLRIFVQNNNKKLISLSPMIRSRLIKINDKPIKISNKKALTREGEREKRFQNRGVNLTYKKNLSDSEKIIEGQPLKNFIEGYENLPEISLEQRYADRINADIGDVLSFDVMGIELKGIVKNLRRVKWTSFEPNFFITFSLGVLEDAPKTFLAAVPKMSELQKAQFQRNLYEKFPNISAVDLDRLVSKIKEVLTQMSVALKSMGFLVIIVGMVVMFSLVNHQLNERKRDLILLKVLGLDIKRLNKIVLNEFTVISFIASSLGAICGILVAFVFSKVLFEGVWVWSIFPSFLSVFIMTGFSAFITIVVSKYVFSKKVGNISVFER